MKNFLNNIAFWLLYGTWYALSLLPLWLHYFFSDILFVIMYCIIGYRRKVVWRNLCNAYPEKTEQERKRLMRGFYRHLCDLIAETVKYTSMSHKSIMRHMTFKGSEQVGEILNSGQSIALLMGHYGNWEWVTSFALWLPPVERKVILAQLYHPLENKVFDRLVLKMRNRMGPVCVPKNDGLRWVIGNKQEGIVTMLGYINDQVPKWQNIHHWLTFLNQETPVFTGVERITRQQRQAVIYLDVKCPRRGYYECEFQVITRDPSTMGQYELTDTFFNRFEQTINRAPQYWLWSHNRWKRTREEFDRRFKVVRGRVVERTPDDGA